MSQIYAGSAILRLKTLARSGFAGLRQFPALRQFSALRRVTSYFSHFPHFGCCPYFGHFPALPGLPPSRSGRVGIRYTAEKSRRIALL